MAASTSSGDADEPYENDDLDPIENWDDLSLPPREDATGVWEHVYEHGRRFHLYKHGRYPMPNDQLEQDRENLKHSMMLLATEDKLFLAPIGDSPQKIIDIGTGTGIWAIEMGDKFPGAQVLGVDLSPIQPEWIPENVRFVIDDCESDWANGSGWDFAHFRAMASYLTHTDQVIKNTFKHLRPGGWIEFQELHGHPYCDDGTMTDSDPILGFFDLFLDGLKLFKMDHDKIRKLRGPLRRAGFTNIQLVKKRIPMGMWPQDPAMQRLGQYLRAVVLGVLPSVTTRLLAGLNMTRLEQEVWIAKVRRSLEDDTIHRYFYLYFWYAQKPEA